MAIKPYYEQDYEDKEYYYLNKPRIKSVEDWKKILKKELEFNTGFDFIHNVLVEIYYSPDKTIFCKELEKKIGRGDISL